MGGSYAGASPTWPTAEYFRRSLCGGGWHPLSWCQIGRQFPGGPTTSSACLGFNSFRLFLSFIVLVNSWHIVAHFSILQNSHFLANQPKWMSWETKSVAQTARKVRTNSPTRYLSFLASPKFTFGASLSLSLNNFWIQVLKPLFMSCEII